MRKLLVFLWLNIRAAKCYCFGGKGCFWSWTNFSKAYEIREVVIPAGTKIDLSKK